MTVVIRSLSGFLAAQLVIAAILGPLFTETITFYVSESARSQYLGGETVTLIAAVVLAVCASARAQWAVTLLPGVCLYLVYTFTTVVAGQSYGLYASSNANAKMAFPMYVLITA